MSNNEIKSAIDQLRDEIEHLAEDNAGQKEKLSALVASLQQTLETPQDDHPHGLLAELRENIEVFEVEHPRITGVLNELMIALSNIGI